MKTSPHRDISSSILADLAELIGDCCADRGWSLEVTPPDQTNPDQGHVARIQNQFHQTIGVASAPGSPADAIAAAFRSAWLTTYGAEIETLADHLYR